MASIINASSTGAGGIIQTADASGALQLQSNGTVGITVNTSGYVAFRDATVGTTALTLRAIGNTYANGALGLQDAAGTNKTYITSISNVTFFGDNTSVDCATINQYGFGVGGTLGTSGLGITFPATQSASSNANTLDDYEEGSWTPTLVSTGTSPTSIVAVSVAGSYTKTGNIVTLRCSALWTWSGGTGSIRVGGIPFTAAGVLSIGTLENGGVTMGGSYTWGGTLLGATDTEVQLRKYSNAGSGETDIPLSNQASGTWIRFTITYQAA